MSSYDIYDFYEKYYRDFDENDKNYDASDYFEKYTNTINAYLQKKNLIYEFKNVESYILLVKSKNKISLSEHKMYTNIQKQLKFKINYRDTEFAIDKNGFYII